MESKLQLREIPKAVHILNGLILSETVTLGKTTATREYTLREVTPVELFNLRVSKKPGLVLKKDGKLYYTEFSENVHFANHNLGPHLCANCSNICKHCEKIDDWTVRFHHKEGASFRAAVYRSGRIEKYPFIPYAVETFNCMTDVYLVLWCDHFEKR